MNIAYNIVCVVSAIILALTYRKNSDMRITMYPMFLLLTMMEIKFLDLEGIQGFKGHTEVGQKLRLIMLMSYITATIMIIGQNFNNRFNSTYFVYVQVLIALALFITSQSDWEVVGMKNQLINYLSFVICFPIIGHLFNHCIHNL
jgi:hypothetical protein